MPRKSTVLPLWVLLLGFAVGCDRAPTDPGVNDVVNLISSANPSVAGDLKAMRSTLPGLFREAIADIELLKGRAAADDAAAHWHRLQNELTARADADRHAIQARLDAIHAEELKIVLRALGTRVVVRAISETNEGLAEARGQIALAAEHGDVTRAKQIAQQVDDRLAAARRALSADESFTALDQATQAAALLAGLQYYLIELRRIPGLETLYPRAAERVNAGEGGPGAAELVLRVKQLNEQARAAARTGDRAAAQQKLQDARAEQARLVVTVLGSESARDLVTEIGSRVERMRAALSALKVSGRDVARYERMLRQAIDLNARAGIALHAGDAGAALDLGSHAAGILNTLQHATWN